MRISIFRVSFVVFIGLLLLGQLQRMFLPIGFTAIYFHEFCIPVMALSLLPESFHLLRRWWRQEYELLRWMLIFVSLLVLSLLVQMLLGYPAVVGWMYLARLLLYGSIWPITWIAVEKKWLTAHLVLGILQFLGFGYLLLGLVQYIFLPNTTFLVWMGWDPHYFRAISTLLDPGFSGAAGVVGLSLSFPWLISSSRLKKILFSIGVLGLLLTYSRASFLGFAAALGVWSWKRKQIKLGAGILAVFIAGMLLLPRPGTEGSKLERTASAEARIRVYHSVFQIENPWQLLYGKGWYLARTKPQHDSTSHRSNASAPDNPLLHVFESAGLPGAVVFLMIILKLSQRIKWNAELLAGWTSLLVGSLFNNLLFYPFLLIEMMMVLTVSSKIYRKITVETKQ